MPFYNESRQYAPYTCHTPESFQEKEEQKKRENERREEDDREWQNYVKEKEEENLKQEKEKEKTNERNVREEKERKQAEMKMEKQVDLKVGDSPPKIAGEEQAQTCRETPIKPKSKGLMELIKQFDITESTDHKGIPAIDSTFSNTITFTRVASIERRISQNNISYLVSEISQAKYASVVASSAGGLLINLNFMYKIKNTQTLTVGLIKPITFPPEALLSDVTMPESKLKMFVKPDLMSKILPSPEIKKLSNPTINPGFSSFGSSGIQGSSTNSGSFGSPDSSSSSGSFSSPGYSSSSGSFGSPGYSSSSGSFGSPGSTSGSDSFANPGYSSSDSFGSAVSSSPSDFASSNSQSNGSNSRIFCTNPGGDCPSSPCGSPSLDDSDRPEGLAGSARAKVSDRPKILDHPKLPDSLGGQRLMNSNTSYLKIIAISGVIVSVLIIIGSQKWTLYLAYISI